MTAAAALRLVPLPKAPAPAYARATDRLQEAVAAMERRYATRGRTRHSTRAMARLALQELGEVLAVIALHLPISTKRHRAFQAATIDPIMALLDRAVGRCHCGKRLASWAPPTGGRLFHAFEHGPACKRAGGV